MKKIGYKVTVKGIIDYLKSGKRYDGRKLFEYRDIDITLGVSKWAEGSVGVKIGKTEVIAGIKMEVAEPYPDHEDEGTMMTGIELLPMASPNFEYGPPRIESIETSRVIDRGIRESGFIDFKELCIKKGERVWNIFIDLAVINDDGNLIDAGSLASIIALKLARFPKYDEKTETIVHKEFTDKGLPLKEKMPITMTFYKAGEKFIVDPTLDEERVAGGRITVEVSHPKGEKEIRINAMQKGGDEAFEPGEIEAVLEEIPEIFKKLNSLIAEKLKK